MHGASPSGRLTLFWVGKDKSLLATLDGGYEWADRDDPRVTEVRLLRDLGAVGEVAQRPGPDPGNLLVLGDSYDALHALARVPAYADQLSRQDQAGCPGCRGPGTRPVLRTAARSQSVNRLPAGPDTGAVQHVYLDQNKWIDLAKARAGHKEKAHLVGVLQAAQEAVRAGDASFPLSAQHYYETLHRGSRESREHLAETMLGLSNGDAIAPAQAVVPYEIEIALIEQLQLPHDRPPAVQIFGKGANHAFNTEMFTYEAPDEYEGHPLPAELRAIATVVGSMAMEFAILAGLSSSETTRLALSEHMRLTGSEFARGQQDLRGRIAEMRRGRLDDAITATAIMDILDPLMAACTRLGVDPGRLLGGGSEVLGPLVGAIPSRWVEGEMRRLRHANRQKQWEGNDLNDVMALSVAVSYCDVVVTESQWVHFARVAKLDQRCKTKMISDLRRLPELLGR